VLLQNVILDIYKDCFSPIYIFSPSIDVGYDVAAGEGLLEARAQTE
jgi:hypothetical protein